LTGFEIKSLKIHQIPSLEQVWKNIEVRKLTFGNIQLQINFKFDYCRKDKPAKSVIFFKMPE